MQVAKRNDIVRIMILLAVVFISAIVFFGSRIFLRPDYIISWPNGSSLIFRSWYLLVGLSLLIIHFISFLKEWYHKFKREIMNLIGLILSVLLLLYCTFGYFGIGELHQYATTNDAKLLSIKGAHIDTINYSFLHGIRIGLLILMAWISFAAFVYCIKLLPVIRRKRTD